MATTASSNPTHFFGLSMSLVLVMTYAHEVSDPVPAVVETAMCFGFSMFVDFEKPSNSLMLRPSWAMTTRAPLAASCEEPPPIEMMPSHFSLV
ncbi:hypothetical protein WY02_13565 [Pseudonocardia sp. AL041005-10]|nr:hypothetical protein WY02_13565 [Pseudonocardia sp. AL041005-10]